MELEWIFFDLGNTLYNETYSDYERVINLLGKNNLGISPSDFLNRMELGAAAYAVSPFSYAREYFGIEMNEPYSSEKEVLFEGVHEVLNQLSEHYHLGILANQPSGTLERLKSDGIFTFFDICLLSETEDLYKPDVAFFEYAVKKADCIPSKIAMVGDRLDNDIMPAKKLGMKTIRIKQGLNAVQKPLSEEYIPDMEIDSVLQLCTLLI
ncbi:MAG: HAD family hydrolase [Lachnospiraceae bacterium]|nr:HAD family hydrolase [Lachnospiraceae bacterium]MDE6626768.1 HAD family hydrolase [Lachnospiraceae bacterium]